MSILAQIDIVGQWVDGGFLPYENTELKKMEPNDVIKCDDRYYRIYKSGKGLHLWLVTQTVNEYYEMVEKMDMEKDCEATVRDASIYAGV